MWDRRYRFLHINELSPEKEFIGYICVLENNYGRSK
jgi:hypothetical protein